MNNLFSDLPFDHALPEEIVEVLCRSAHVRIERIVSTGHASPDGFWYDQAEDEWVVLLKGTAELRFEDASNAVRMTVGDHLVIPAHRKHRVVMTSPDEPTVWLAVFIRRDDSHA